MHLLFNEILEKVSKAKTKPQKIDVLREHQSESLKMLIKSSFDPKIEWAFPEGSVPYVPNEAPAGTEHTVLESECRKLWHFIKGADKKTPQFKKEQMFIQMLEGLQEEEAKVLLSAKDKKLHQMYKGLSKQVVKEAFNWNDEFMLNE
tara:strand:- start:5395 stop:5835 length:441 start_codon:yes stop_codon:yes gene_type:complete